MEDTDKAPFPQWRCDHEAGAMDVLLEISAGRAFVHRLLRAWPGAVEASLELAAVQTTASLAQVVDLRDAGTGTVTLGAIEHDLHGTIHLHGLSLTHKGWVAAKGLRYGK